MKNYLTPLRILCVSILLCLGGIYALKAQDIPLVYDVENTAASLPTPTMPAFDALPVVEQLPDPFAWKDGSGRDESFAAWERHRAEWKYLFEKYEIGAKPDRPENITASFVDGLLTVNISVGGETLTLTSRVVLPEGAGKVPAVIGIGGGSGSIPATVFNSRNIAQIPFAYTQVMAHEQTRGNEPINRLYPELTYIGAYSAWSWGVSRLIDGIEIALSDRIDTRRLAVTGCSFAGKMALFAGAFDERIALTLAQESGGGGYTAWRVSETLGPVENLGSTSNKWFIEQMWQFAGNNVPKLPIDHHELMAMVAPRALLVTGNPDYEWLADPSGYIASRAAQKIYKTLGIEDRFGFSIVAGHSHCAVPAIQVPEIEAFVDKFLLGVATAQTAVETHPYDYLDYNRWFAWWGSDDPSLPPPDLSGYDWNYMEAECATVGAHWPIVDDADASNGKYAQSPETQGLPNASTDADDHIAFPFTAQNDATYYIYGRMHCLTADDDSFYSRMDGGAWSMQNGLSTGDQWQWKRITSYRLTAGEHTYTLANRENGAKVDKVAITDSPYLPEGLGDDAGNCHPDGMNEIPLGAYSLDFTGARIPSAPVEISFSIPVDSYVTLKLYNASGTKIAEGAGKRYPAGRHAVALGGDHPAPGIYLCVLQAGNFTTSKKLIQK
jgi:hypothetical protein